MISAKSRYNSLIPKVSRKAIDFNSNHDKKNNYFLNETFHPITEDNDGLLHIAVVSDDVQLVTAIVEKLSKIYGSNEIDRFNLSFQTPLHLAVCIGNENIIRKLVEIGGASLHLVDRNGNNVLHLAVKYEKIDCVRLLLNYLNSDLNSNSKRFQQQQQQHEQQQYRNSNINTMILDKLSLHKLSLNNHFHHHHQQQQQQYNQHEQSDKEKEVTLRKSKNHYQILNGLNKEGLTPLHLACSSHNYRALITTLVSGGADIDAIDGLSGRTPLLYTLLSSNHNKGAIQKLLLSLNSDPWIADYSGNKSIDFLENISL